MQITTIGLDIAKNVFQPCRFLAVPHLSRREELLAALVFPVFTEPLDARNLGLAEHGEELIPAPRKVARVGWQKGLDFSCHLSPNCSDVPLLNRNANIDRGVNVTVQYSCFYTGTDAWSRR
jgi:hypothetical protein